MKFSFVVSTTLPYVLLPILCLVFDETLKISRINSSDILRAFFDNMAHGAIAFLSWLAVAGINKRGFAESVFCGVLACAIDVDHFVMAKSFNMKVDFSPFLRLSISNSVLNCYS